LSWDCPKTVPGPGEAGRAEFEGLGISAITDRTNEWDK